MQQDIATTRSIEGVDGHALTIGLDVGDRYTHVHALGAGGEVVRERRVRTAAAALGAALTGLPRSRVVLEAGPRSPWLSRVVAELGHEVVVANPRQVALIARNQRKTDRLDAEWLARLGRFDPELLSPIRHRSEQSQHDLAVVRGRGLPPQGGGPHPRRTAAGAAAAGGGDRRTDRAHRGAYLGLVPRQHESGERAPQLRISKSGDAGLRRLLVQAAHYILGPFGPDTDLRRWGERYAATGAGNAKKRAVVAVARRLAVLLLALWKTGEVYDPLRHAAAREAA